MDDGCLILEPDSNGWRLHFVATPSACDELVAGKSGYRLSPIFPVGPKPLAPDLGGNCILAMYAVENAFVAIGTLLARDEGDENHLWFSYGVPSLLYFAPTQVEADAMTQALGPAVRAVEMWSISAHTVRPLGVVLSSPAVFNLGDFQVSNTDPAVDPAAAFIVTEIGHAIRSLVPLAAQYCPSLLPVYHAFTQDINNIVGNLNEYSARRQPVSSTYSLEHQVADQQRINSYTDLLVQINSMLAYSHSQLFGGAPPVIESRSYVHSHSLLGIGTAVLAIHAFLAKVNAAFSEIPVSAVVRLFSLPKPIPVFRNLQDVDLTTWDDLPAQVDHILDSNRPNHQPARTHLLFFSGRLGFQEAKHSISAALQAVPFAATIRWTPLTLSHEIMHAHVRELLASLIVADVRSSTGAAAFATLYARYAGFINKGLDPENLKEAIQFALLNYVRWRVSFSRVELTNGGGTASDKWPSEELLWRGMRQYFRDMNEVIVHVLDFKYFYGNDADLYIDYLWQSWSTVPSVLENLEHYVLRSIAVVSITYSGSLTDRFRSAVKYLQARIEGLMPSNPDNPLFQKVYNILCDQKTLTRLTMVSLANQYLAELTVRCLFSSHIAGILSRDAMVDVAGDEPRYTLEVGEFPGTPVESPIALLLDRVRRALKASSGDGKTDQYRAAWLYLACASAIA